MHSTTTTAPKGRSRWVFLTLLGTLLLLTLAQAVPAFAASSPFDGGPLAIDTAMSVANDHTVYAMRFNATTGGSNQLAANTTYYVKLRFTPNADGSPAGVDNRGFTWNGTAWIQEREDWTSFPTVTTGADGVIAQSNWLYYKFGDTTKTGTYRVLVSLSAGTSGTTRNGNITIPVTLLDQTSTGAWVHDGIATGAGTGKRALVVDEDNPADIPLACQRTETNGVDDDGDGIIDNEVYGLVQSGGFRLALPTGQVLYTAVKDAIWPAGSTGFTITTPDTDIALGSTVTDQIAPTAPTAPAATAQDAGAVISWTAATDATGVAGYHVYRWTDAPVGSGYTPMPVKVGTVTTGTSYTDTGLTNGTTYHYLVRAFDAATNVGPRSTTVEATPLGATTLTLGAAPTTVNWAKPWTLSGALTAGGAAIPDAAVKLMQSLNAGSTWVLVDTLTPAAGTSTYTGSIAAPLQKSTYKLVYEGDASHVVGESSPVTVTPRVKLGAPVAPKAVKKGRKFTAYGSLTPKHSAGSKTVKIKCYQKKSGKWKLRTTVTAKNQNYKTYSRYSAKFALKAKGSWKLVAYSAATAKYASKTSSARYVKVK